MYSIQIKKSAIKEIESIPSFYIKKIINAIEKLSENPKPDGCKKIVGSKENMWRIRIGDYRIIYVIDENLKIVDVRRVSHRKDAYKF
jgi:mRNA interferase RelE/StbE